MRFNPKARLDSGRVRQGGGGGGFGRGGGMGGGGGRMPIPIPTGRGGIGSIIVIILFVILSQCTGIGPQLPGGGGGTSTGSAFDTSNVASKDQSRYAKCRTGADAESDLDCQRIGVENSLRDYWSDTLGERFQPATMTTFPGQIQTACGNATAAVGPFYCPGDMGIYLDTTFFDDVLERQLGGPEGEFVEPYVLAHEYGHHIQNLLDIMSRVRTQQGPRSDAVRLELQADCFAGVWAAHAPETTDANGEQLILEITQQDADQAIDAAEAVGDDRIQQKTQGQVTEESWTHGSAASRKKWFGVGLESGDPNECEQVWQVRTP